MMNAPCPLPHKIDERSRRGVRREGRYAAQEDRIRRLNKYSVCADGGRYLVSSERGSGGSDCDVLKMKRPG